MTCSASLPIDHTPGAGRCRQRSGSMCAMTAISAAAASSSRAASVCRALRPRPIVHEAILCGRRHGVNGSRAPPKRVVSDGTARVTSGFRRGNSIEAPRPVAAIPPRIAGTGEGRQPFVPLPTTSAEGRPWPQIRRANPTTQAIRWRVRAVNITRGGEPMSDQEQVPETLAVFVLDNGAAAKRLLEAVEKIDEVNDNVQIVDAAIAERTKRRGAVKVHQTRDRGALKGGVRGTAIGVVVGTIIAGPAGAVVAGAAGGLLHSLRSRFHDIGIDDKFMKQVSKEIEKGKSALFVQYTGTWAASIGLVEQAIQAENALLITSTLPAETAAALRALVEPAAESLGGDEVVADFEIEVEEAPEEAAPEEEAPPLSRRAPAMT